MVVKDNFSELSMLLNEPIHFIIYEDDEYTIKYEFDMKIPTVRNIYFDTKFKIFLGIINTPIEDIHKQFYFIENLDSFYQLFKTLLVFGTGAFASYIHYFLYSFNLLNIKIVEKGADYFIEDLELEYSLFNRIIQIILISAGLKKKIDFIEDPRLQAAQNKINKIKNKNANKETESFEEFQDTFITLTYEFNYKPEEILNMNMFLVHTILSYTGKSIGYKTSLIAAGNGLSKKVDFITKKGRK